VIEQRLLRTDLAGVRAALARRGRPSLLDEVDEAALLDARVLDISGRRDAIRARVNSISKEVGQLRRDGDVEAAEQLQAESRELGDEERTLAAEHDELSTRLRELLLGIPNLPHPDAPDGVDDRDNPIVTGPIGLSEDVPDHLRVPHWETATALGILDNERAVKISGAMFTMQRGAGATLARALCQYGLDLNAVNTIKGGLAKGDFKTAFGAVSDQMIDAFSIYGTPQDMLAKIAGLEAAGCTQIVAGSPIGADKNQSIRLIGKYIV